MNYDRPDRKSRSIRLPELLAPAGSFSHLKAAINAGADAVYIGGHRFGARAYADNFSTQDVVESLHYAHFYGRKIYMTVNTLMKEKELEGELYSFLLPFYEAGLDGVIVQDLGVASFIGSHFPGMEIHGSTQMTITDVYGTRAARRMGMCRVVSARELSLDEIRAIKKEGVDVEVFVHGALCYCYSGQCLMSSTFGGRSGNRGRCAQPCRLPWTLFDEYKHVIDTNNKNYLLSLKDLCGLPHLPDLVQAGVDSLKIEGRMKNIEYVAGVTAIYRKYLDRIGETKDYSTGFKVDPEDIRTLEELYTRGDFTDGYFKQHNGARMMAAAYPRNTGRKIGVVRSARRNKVELELTAPVVHKDLLVIPAHRKDQEVLLTVPDTPGEENKKIRILNLPAGSRIKPGSPVYRRHSEELSQEIYRKYVEEGSKLPVKARVTARQGQKVQMTLSCMAEPSSVTEVGIEGAVVENSQKRPITKEDIERQIRKTGNVPFYAEEIIIDLEEGSFLPMSEMKRLRQAGYALLQEKLERRGERRGENAAGPQPDPVSEETAAGRLADDDNSGPCGKYSAIAVVYNPETLEYILNHDYFDEVCLPMEHLTDQDMRKMLSLCKEKEKSVHLSLPRVFRGDTRREKDWILSGDFDGIVIHNINEAQFAHELQDQMAIPVTAAASFYQWNRLTYKVMADLFPEISRGELPLECSWQEIEELIGTGMQEQEILVYGRNPLMISAQCLKKTTGKCDHQPGRLLLGDQDRSMIVSNHCDRCYNLIWQDKPRNLIGVSGSHVISRIPRHRFDLFGIEAGQTHIIDEICQVYRNWVNNHFSEDRSSDDMRWTKGIE